MTTENAQPQSRVRYRIKLNRLAKGQMQFECSVELEGPVELIGADHEFPSRIALGKLQEAALEESDRLVAALQAKYPMGVE